MDLLKSKKNVENFGDSTQNKVVCFSTLLGSINIIFFMFFFLSFLLDDDAMMIIPLLYALVLLRSFVGRFALITIASDRVCDALFQAGERACKSNNEKLKNSENNFIAIA